MVRCPRSITMLAKSKTARQSLKSRYPHVASHSCVIDLDEENPSPFTLTRYSLRVAVHRIASVPLQHCCL